MEGRQRQAQESHSQLSHWLPSARARDPTQITILPTEESFKGVRAECLNFQIVMLCTHEFCDKSKNLKHTIKIKKAKKESNNVITYFDHVMYYFFDYGTISLLYYYYAFLCQYVYCVIVSA